MGRGGTVLTERDTARLADFFQISPEDFLSQYAETIAGKPRIATGADGFCIFFKMDVGCAVHIAKPDVCRAWPFFRGNLLDKTSFLMAKEDCPGIGRDCDFDTFVAYGIKQVVRLNADNDTADLPNALKVSSAMENGDENGKTRASD